MKVMKFGGTSVGSVKSILSLKKIVVEKNCGDRGSDATCRSSSKCT